MAIICAMKITAQKSVNDDLANDRRLNSPFSIGQLTLPNRVFLAPMSGVTDLPFRDLAAKAGAGLVVSEMVASQEFVKGNAESLLRSERGIANIHMVQLAGREAHWMGEAARKLEANGADIVDINMGCPAKKVTGGYSGSALMRDLDHAMTLIEATVKAASVPVTLKMRLGWDDQTINAPELARRAQDAGIQMITVHGRTRCQFYEGKADWDAVWAVREAVTVPLIVNGDIVDGKAALEALQASGADAVMSGRAHFGRPWFAGMLARGGVDERPAGLDDYVIAHYEAMLSHYGLTVGVRHARKHLASYLDRWAKHVAAATRAIILGSSDAAIVIDSLRTAFSEVALAQKELAA